MGCLFGGIEVGKAIFAIIQIRRTSNITTINKSSPDE